MNRGLSGRPVAVAVCVAAAIALSASSAASQTDEQAIAATVEAVFAASERADYTGLDTLYAGEDLTIIEGAGIDRGWTEYRDQHLKPELEAFKSFVYRPYDIEVYAVGSLAYAIFRYDLKIELEERTVDNVGRGTAILEKRGERWVLRHMQTTSRPRR
jgi:ketosteroid isomerase-like protein